jgi:hypothetical protein
MKYLLSSGFNFGFGFGFVSFIVKKALHLNSSMNSYFFEHICKFQENQNDKILHK